ncbi:BCS1 N terminal-domain-containing protein [Globomyces pollinis-pini]|nr:BCS1 N terminal-domain-containing protein [Globomyces pollinis-pini]
MEAFLAGNPYFSAGAGILGLTAVSGLAMKGVGHLSFLAKRRLLVSLEIPSKDRSYPWFLDWMAKQSKIKPKDNSIINRMMNKKLHQLSVETIFTKEVNGSSTAHFTLVPGQGKHFFQYKDAWFQVERTRESKMIDITNGSPWETVMITTLSRDRDLFLEMLEEAKDAALEKEVGKTVVYTSYGHEWRPFGTPRRRRPLESVVLDGDIAKLLVDDVQQFLNGSKWYHDRGIPYRRGFLLYGPPGTGKTSFIQSLAGELEYNICIMNLAELGMTDDRFAHLLNNIPPRSIILLEDVDAAFSDRTAVESQKKGYQSMLTLSGLLNGLDGVVAAEERMIFMTTNHAENLDAALTRAGRVDYKMYVGNATGNQAAKMFLRFYEGQEKLSQEFVDELKQLGYLGRLSPATLQGHFVTYKDDAKSAISNLNKIQL